MRFAVLNNAQTEEVYLARMTADFPPEELKPLARIRRAVAEGRYLCSGLFDGEALLAYGFFVILRENGRTELLLDYFAVDAAHRGQGIGSAYLRMLPEQFSEVGAVLIEAEVPESAVSDADRLLRERRIRFYQRNGCRDSGLEAEVFGVRFRLLELPLRTAHAPSEIRQIYSALYRQILPPAVFRAQIRLCD